MTKRRLKPWVKQFLIGLGIGVVILLFIAIDRLRTTVLPHKLNVYGVFLLLRYSLNTVEIGS